MSEPSGLPPKEDAARLVLRGKPRPIVRFRRGLIVGASGAVALAVISLSWVALQPPSLHKTAAALENEQSDGKPPADTLAGLPRNYADVPRLGPPLPGDLGRPILEHERSLGQPSDSGGVNIEAERGDRPQDIARDRALEAREAARTSPVLVQLEKNGSGAAVTQSEPLHPISAAALSAAAAEIPASQQHKIEFSQGSENGAVSPHGLSSSPSPWTLSAGTIIPASLITGLNSDLPGVVIAQVTQNVRDSATGSTVLIPQGARLIGRYDSAVAYGQRRALLIWTRLIFPDGSSVELDNMPASDASGYAGLADKVDSHSWQLLKGVVLSTLLGVGTQLSLGSSESDLVRAIRESAQQNGANAGNQITSRNLEVQPTIKVRPGWPVRARLNKDIVLQPWIG